MEYLLSTLLGYCFGNINPAYILSKLKGFDIRERGSGNAGASNVVITLGKKAGAFTALFDIAKAAVSSLLATLIFPQLTSAKVMAGCGCILGHIFPVVMQFRGGKGLACLAGTILAWNWKVFLVLLAIEIVLGLSVDYICVVPMTGSVIFTIVYALMTNEPVGTVLLAVIAVIIQFKHIINLKRIRSGTEAHISFLWNNGKKS